MNELSQLSKMQQCKASATGFIARPVSERILYTAFLLVIGIAYLAALANMYFAYENLDGNPGFSIEDVIVKYHGSDQHTRLETAINGIMASNLKRPADKAVIMAWIQNGADETGFDKEVAPILKRDCVNCHTPSVNPSLPDLTSYHTVSDLARISGASLPSLLRLAHIHLFGISFILFFVGKIFLMCELNSSLKSILLALPFVALVIDVGSWFATRLYAEFAYAIVGSGIMIGFSIGMQIFISIYLMWNRPKQLLLINPVYEH
jgi:hypothetical protein